MPLMPHRCRFAAKSNRPYGRRLSHTRTSDAAAVPEDCGLCHLGRHQPDVERVPLKDRHIAALLPTAQRHNAAVHLLPRNEVDILVLIEVLAIALGAMW